MARTLRERQGPSICKSASTCPPETSAFTELGSNGFRHSNGTFLRLTFVFVSVIAGAK